MSRIKYYDEVTGRWEYADQAHGSDSGQNVNQYTFLNGLKYIAWGDSITEIQGTTADPKLFGNWYTTDLQGRDLTEITVSGYVQAIENRYGLVATNYGVSGGTIIAKASQMISTDYSDVALVTIAYGVNDARTGVPLGTVNSTDISTFAGALNQVLRKIYTDNPECRVVILTPIQRLYVSDFGIATPNANGNYLIDFVNMCKAVAEKRSTKCIDMYRGCGINQTNLYYYTVEGVHPINQGFVRMTGAIIPVLDDLFAVEFEPFGTMTNTGDTEPDEPDTGGDSGEDTPPEEDTGATEVTLTDDMFTVDGVYYDTWGSIFGKGSYNCTEAIETIRGKTYTLVTYIVADGNYFGTTCDSADFSTHGGTAFALNKVSASTSTETIDGVDYKRVEYTWAATQPYVFVGKSKNVPASKCSLSYV